MPLSYRSITLVLALAALPLSVDAQPLVSRGEAAAGVVVMAGALLLDDAVHGMVPTGGGTRWEGASAALNYGGRPQYALVLLGGAWTAGTLAGRGEVADAALHVTAALAAGGVANGLLKYSVGRERPSTTADPLRFRPLNGRNRWQSFPSGHAVVVFSLASALSEEARTPWVTALAYGGAAMVGWSRVYDDKHWTSDVAAGALVGILAGRSTVRLLHRAGEDDADPPLVTVAPGVIAVRIHLR
ncbi:phosphatase PAP2 family protein [Longimicrobium sp.]|uniref:phosphatase PAP2 family protein n=1 Tax=Longimicrobium sp. TaxID=2029185 RepID=UPI003B3AC61E